VLTHAVFRRKFLHCTLSDTDDLLAGAVQVPAVRMGLEEEERIDETRAAGIPFTLSNIFLFAW